MASQVALATWIWWLVYAICGLALAFVVAGILVSDFEVRTILQLVTTGFIFLQPFLLPIHWRLTYWYYRDFYVDTDVSVDESGVSAVTDRYAVKYGWPNLQTVVDASDGIAF